jgi:hypothetical protein
LWCEATGEGGRAPERDGAREREWKKKTFEVKKMAAFVEGKTLRSLLPLFDLFLSLLSRHPTNQKQKMNSSPPSTPTSQKPAPVEAKPCAGGQAETNPGTVRAWFFSPRESSSIDRSNSFFLFSRAHFHIRVLSPRDFNSSGISLM